MPKEAADIAAEYTAGLHEYLSEGGEAALQRAYESGRSALSQGLGVLDMITMHGVALEWVLQKRSLPEPAVEFVRSADHYLLESLSPFEMTHRGVREANALLRRLNQTLEEEYKRIAHALHDEAGQLLVSVRLALNEAARCVPPARERLDGIKGLLDQIERQLRQLSHELRPMVLDDLGLLPALKFLADGVAARTGLRIAIEGDATLSLLPLMETVLYRVVQEALTNVARHAGAVQVRIDIRQDSQFVRCSIKDDGAGFDESEVLARTEGKGLGLVGMRERVNSLGGSLSIVSNRPVGTELIVTIPHVKSQGT
jgi:signal transduction histidine kinase